MYEVAYQYVGIKILCNHKIIRTMWSQRKHNSNAYLFRTLTVIVKYAERHKSHAMRPDSFVFGPESA